MNGVSFIHHQVYVGSKLAPEEQEREREWRGEAKKKKIIADNIRERTDDDGRRPWYETEGQQWERVVLSVAHSNKSN
jgi:hypothetical protein